MRAISLFASSGIGDLALRSNGVEVIVANELLKDRASLFSRNFPAATMLTGDVWQLQQAVIDETKARLGDGRLDILLATPPCQGMSKNGQGKLLSEIRAGRRPAVDPRNRLIIPTMNIACALRPRLLIFENVPEMDNTYIDDETGQYIKIVDYIRARLGEGYEGYAQAVEFADYGVPQRRKRLITVFTDDAALLTRFKKTNSFLPAATHAKDTAPGLLPWVTVRATIADLPPLDAKDKQSATSDIPYHAVPVLDPKKYDWISHTPPEKGALANQCENPDCLYDQNPVHGSARDSDGINRPSEDTPILCVRCGQLLPRPYTVTKDGSKRLMKAFTSAYKRMRWDLPASTLTTNLQYPSSDHKVHPSQHRVLSLYEAFRLHTLDRYDYTWELPNGKPAAIGLIRDTIGESIPPYALDVIIESLLEDLRSPDSRSRASLRRHVAKAH